MSRQNLIKVLSKIDLSLSRIIEVVCVVLLAAVVLTISISVLTRFIIFTPLNFANPLAKYLMIWLSFLGAGLAFRYGEHIAVDILIDRLQGTSKKVLLVTINILVSIFLVYMIYYGFTFAMSGVGSRDPLVFNMSMVIPYLSVPVSFIYILIQLNLTTVLTLLKNDHSDNHATGAL